MKEQTTWTVEEKSKEYPTLASDIATDVVIIGGGMCGILSAYLLHKAGKKVVIIEKETLGHGATMFTTAFLTQSLDTDFGDLIKSFGMDSAKAIVASHGEATNLIRKIVKEENIDCELDECSNFVYTNTEKDFNSLDEDLGNAKKLGLDVELIQDGVKLGFKNTGYLEIKNQGKFHPLKFLTALAEKLSKEGVEMYEHTEAHDVESHSGIATVHAGKHTITAHYAIVNTYEPFNNPLKLYFRKGLYKSYVFEVEVTGTKLQEGVYEDTENPYHYMRIDKEGDIYRMVIGGEDHRNDIPVNEEKNFNALKEYLETIIPKEKVTITKKWTGPMLEPIDGLPSIGTINEENILYALAFSGNGMTYSGIAASIFHDHITGAKNPYAKIYAASRFPGLRALLTKGIDYSEELIDGAVKNTLTQSKDPVVIKKSKKDDK